MRVPPGWHDWYDWVVVYRYWTGDAAGLRRPYRREQLALMRLGADMSVPELAARLGVTERTIFRWRELAQSGQVAGAVVSTT